MSKREKIKFEDLEKLGDGPPVPMRTDDEFIEIISVKDTLKDVIKKEGATFISQLFGRMVESKKFRDLVNGLIDPAD